MRFPRLRISHILPMTLFLIVALLVYRSIMLEQDMEQLVVGRKSYDAAIISDLTSGVSRPQILAPELQREAIEKMLKDSHRSTRVLVSSVPGAYSFDNSSSIAPGQVPNYIVKMVLAQWVKGEPLLFAGGWKIEAKGKAYHAVIRSTKVLVRSDASQKAKEETRYIVLITNLEESVKKYYLPSVIALGWVGMMIMAGVFFTVAPVVIPLGKIAEAVKKGKLVKIMPWWPFEIAALTKQYNRFVKRQAAGRRTLEENSQLLKNVINGIPNSIIFVKGEDRRYIIANESMVELAGQSPIGLTDQELWPDRAAEYQRNDDKAIAGEIHLSVLEQVDRSGSTEWVSSSKVLLMVNGRPAVLGVSLDVTALVTARNELEKLYRSLRHDIISAAGGVLNMFNKLREKGFIPGEEYRELYELAEDRATLTHRLVEGTGKIGQDIKISSVAIDEIFADLKTLFADDNVTFDTEGTAVRIEVDRNAFVLKVMSNLISNAIKYSDEGNKNVSVGVIQNTSTVEDNKVMIFVQDHGFGLTPGEVVQIMNNYGQAARLRPEIDGSGTGLYTVQEVLKAHGIKLGVRSKKGSGSLFYMEILKSNV